jgi:FKBP-type peptidyl-prolyl cis-trans isomerase FkpA
MMLPYNLIRSEVRGENNINFDSFNLPIVEERMMSRLMIAVLLTLLTSPVFAAEAQKNVKAKTPEEIEVQGVENLKAKLAAANKAYYDKAAAEKGTIKTGSGLLYRSLKEGSGASPNILSTVKVHFRGTLINGKEFNSSYKRKMPVEHRMNRVFRCWQEGLQKMKVGGKAKLVCPPELAFRGNGAGSAVPPNAIVTYEIELLGVK